jgi:hypothetical protein
VVHAHANAYVSCITVAQRLHSCKQTQLKITADSLYVLVHLAEMCMVITLLCRFLSMQA